MAGKVTYRLAPETRNMFPAHAEFYASVLDLFQKGQSPLVLKSKDPEARTEAEVKANGDVEVTLVLPLDDNDEAGDGRILLKDRFVFDPTQKVLKSYRRSFEANGQGIAAHWESRLTPYQALLRNRPKLNDLKLQRFALDVARTYGAALVDEQEKTLPLFHAVFSREHRYLDSADALIQEQGRLQGVEGLRLRIKDKESHYQVLRRGGEIVELIFHFAVDRDGSGDNGRIWLKDRFSLEAGKLKSLKREWSIDPRSVGRPKVEAVLAGLKLRADPDFAESKAFAENLYPDLVPQENPHPMNVMPLLAASVQTSGGTSPFKDRAKKSAQTLAAQKQTLALLRSLSAEHLAKRAEEAQGLLSFGGGDFQAEQSVLASLFQKLEGELNQGKAGSLKKLLAELPLGPAEAKLRQDLQSLKGFDELNSLAEEIDPELRGEGLLRLGEQFLARGYAAVARAIAEGLGAAPGLKDRAKKLLERTMGKGDFGSKVEFVLGHFHQEVTKPSMLVGMMAAPFAGVALEAGGLRLARLAYDMNRIRRIGTGIRLGASGLGMFGEALAFTGFHRGYERLWHGSETAWRGAGAEVLSSMLLFGAMRAAHAGSAWAGARMAEGKLNFSLRGRPFHFGGRQGAAAFTPELASVAPSGRLLLSDPWVAGAGTGVPTLSRLGAISTGLMNHVGGIGAIQASSWVSQFLAERLGWTPVSAQGWMNDVFDSTLGYLQALLGFKLANYATRGRLQPALGEAKMRIGAADAIALPPPQHPAGRRGLHRPLIPELRLFDMNQGNAMFDFRLMPGQVVSLDHIFFGQDGQRIMVGLDRDSGGMYLYDRRPKVENQANVPRHHVRIFNIADQALLLNRQPLPNQTKVAIREGDNLRLGVRFLHFAMPRSSAIYSQLSRLQPQQQMRIAARIEAAGDIEALVRAMEVDGWDLKLVSENARAVWEGRELLHSLPVELGLQAKVEAMIQADLRRGEREGLDEMAVKLKPGVENPRWSPLERSFQINRAIEQLQEELKGASSAIEVAHLLRTSKFQEIEDKPVAEIALAMNMAATAQFMGSVQTLPYTAGIRQRVRDILERDNYWAAIRLRDDGRAPRPRDQTMQGDYNRLHESLNALYAHVKNSEVLKREAPGYSVADLEELIYQVLERGQPLEILPSADGLRGKVSMYQSEATRTAERLYPVEMEAKVDPWTGEKVNSNNREARYRLALHVLNLGSRRPVLGVPSHHERHELSRLVKKYLDQDTMGNFLKAQEVLRDHLDRATPEAHRLLRKAAPKEKALLLGLYFGPYRRRDLSPATAFQVSTWMGQAGMFREVGVTYEIRHDALKATLSLGNLGNVEPQSREDFFALHTHPEDYLNPDGLRMGWENLGHVQTINLADARIDGSTLNILPSQVDLRLFFEKSQEYWRRGFPQKFGETPLYSINSQAFRNWVVHSKGISEVRVPLDAVGKPQRIEVHFAKRRLAGLFNGQYQAQKQALEAMSAEFGIPVVVTEVDYAGLIREMPYGTRSILDAPPSP